MKTAAIMQPTFLPWLGYFALMKESDVFVFLDDVQFVKRSWQCRNQIKGPDGTVMLSLSIKKNKRDLIKYIEFNESEFERKMFKTIAGCLGNAPFFPLVENILQEAVANSQGSLCKLNVSLISAFSDVLGIKTLRVLSSDLGVSPGEKSDRLLEICKVVGANKYLSAVGSAEYLATYNPFEKSEVNLDFFQFEHPVYTQQFSGFHSHLSIVDALANLGPDAVMSIINDGVQKPKSICELGVRE